jgi:outer membrane protein assembly factor BamB
VDAGLSFITLDANGRHLEAYRVRDGSLRWTYAEPNGFVSGIGGPFYSSGLVFAFTLQPNNFGHVMLVAVSASDGHPAWHLRLSGTSWWVAFSGSNIVVLDQEFVMRGQQEEAHFSVLVARVADGSQVTEFPVDAARADFAVEGDMAFVCSSSGDLDAYRLSDGQLMWRTPATDLGGVPVGAPGGAPGATNTIGCEPHVFDGTIYVRHDYYSPAAPIVASGTLDRVRESDGRVLWTYRTPDWLPSAGIRGAEAELNGAVFVLMSTSTRDSQHRLQDAVVALRDSDGSELWRQFIDYGTNVLADVTGTRIILVQGDDLHAANAANGSPVWRYHETFHSLKPMGTADGVVIEFSTTTHSLHTPVPFGTDTMDYLVALNVRDGSVYWRLPFYTDSIVIGDA